MTLKNTKRYSCLGTYASINFQLSFTSDHTCEDEEEHQRVTSCGARVDRLDSSESGEKEGPLRIFKGSLPYPGIVVTRTLGDTVAAKLGVICEPDVSVQQIDPSSDALLVLGSDGVWDGLSNQDVIDIVKANLGDIQKASKLVTKKSITGMQKKNMASFDLFF